MSKIFITGDRTMAVVYPGQVAIELLRAVHAGKQIVTGDNVGVEEFVRILCEQADIPFETLPTPTGDDGRPDWDARHAVVDIETVVIHADPHASSITKSIFNTIPEKLVRLSLVV